MQDNAHDPSAELAQWAEQGHQNAVGIADMLGVSQPDYERDVLNLMGPLQDYVNRLPLDEFEQSDWVTLHADLASYLADVMIQRHYAQWVKVEDNSKSRGFRYMLRVAAVDGSAHDLDPYDLVMEEFRNLPIQVARLIANAEVTAGVVKLMRDE
ncbi:hypothetical protein [Streptomyces silvisoli]|uniref:Uncharacterized protein n=1 Tax=Streptomyces silvisoli TaxID=3034235 RepID=A0ABT5ZJV4_9ACTN|nr:hypothetical protein [Streptomyces silvisoli]MDF3290117.1 hypothetical protein [Streptomyces silvisoli]